MRFQPWTKHFEKHKNGKPVREKLIEKSVWFDYKILNL